MIKTKRKSARTKTQRAVEVVILAPKNTLKEARITLKNALARNVKLRSFNCSPKHGFRWGTTKKSFLNVCRKAKVVIINDWIQANGAQVGYCLAALIAAEAKIANPEIKTFALPTGGAWESAIHKIAEMIFSFSDPALINALKA